MKKALITGITGQDGSYLAELLLEKGYEVHGIIRRASNFNTERIDHIFTNQKEYGKRFFLHHGDLNDSSSLNRILEKTSPDEIYNLGAQSHVKVSFEIPEYTAEIDAIGTLRLLDAIRETGIKNVRFYQASSSEMFGKVLETPQRETTPFYPRSPYGCAKVYAYWITVNYRESYNLFACNGILFNHESPRRGRTFVTKKITEAVAKIHYGKQDCLYIGNLDAKRDWGYAKDYVEAMYMMLQAKQPDDYVIATGETHSVREFTEESFRHVGIELAWKGKGLDEYGVDVKTGRTLVRIDEKYFRPTEVDLLLGDSSKAKQLFGWAPRVKFKELCQIMMEHDLSVFKP
ncbi:MAG: GDP-mannose 4,6-dehydratase [Spirochaetes bacterium]|nr:GDP-mannose 4,6-dehydratase [Spirochaetota bacterium]